MLEAYIRRQIEKKTFPGITILAASRGRVDFHRWYGNRASWPAAEPLAADTLYDLASLTKPLVTAFLALVFVEKKQWRLEDDVRRFLPSCPLAVSLEQLLTHSAGFRPWHPFYLYRPLDDLAQIAALPDRGAAGARVLYSDVGYILLRHLLEKVSGSNFQQLAAEVIFRPLRLNDTFFIVPEELKPRCAPTEIGNRYERSMAEAGHGPAAAGFAWRRELIRGDAHDANSFYAGGSAGNAGLFSSAADLFKLTREFFPVSATLLRGESVAFFWQNRTPWDPQGRTIGFQLNSTPRSSAGRALAGGAIGHNGFTGTSLWLEAEGQRQWIVLTNRVHPRVKKIDFNVVRRRLHRLLQLEAGAATSGKSPLEQ
jgi:CubicO group peptidase (beta-lactamase class C family)